jgi:hypothetical protein
VIRNLGRKLEPLPVPRSFSLGLSTQVRKAAVQGIFAAIAGAYLRFSLLKAQGSCEVMDLSRFVGDPLSLASDKVLTWNNLEDLAKKIEFVQAKDFTDETFAGGSPTPYQASVTDAISRFGQTYRSLFRQIATCKQNSAESSAKMHQRWSSVDAYLEDVQQQQKFVSDDGIDHLLLKWKQLTLKDDLDLLELSQVPNTGVSAKKRQVFVRELLTSIFLADEDYKAVNRSSILRSNKQEDLKVQLRITAEITEAIVMKKAMRRDWAPMIEDQMYKREAKSILDMFIDSPIDALTATVRESHPELLISIMNERNSGPNSSKNNPISIEKIHAPAIQDEDLDEPPTKIHREYSPWENECECPWLAQEPWFHYGGGNDDGPMEPDEDVEDEDDEEDDDDDEDDEDDE